MSKVVMLLLGVACASAAANSNGGQDDPACAPMDARGDGECDALLHATWDGTNCEMVSGCGCAGSDCERTFADRAACEAHYRHCME